MGNAFSWSSRQPRQGQGRLHAAVVDGPTTSGLQVVVRTTRSRGAVPNGVLFA